MVDRISWPNDQNFSADTIEAEMEEAYQTRKEICAGKKILGPVNKVRLLEALSNQFVRRTKLRRKYKKMRKISLII